MSDATKRKMKVIEKSTAYVTSVEVLSDFKEHFKHNRKLDYFEACRYLAEITDKYYEKYTESRIELAEVDAAYAQSLLDLLETGGEQV